MITRVTATLSLLSLSESHWQLSLAESESPAGPQRPLEMAPRRKLRGNTTDVSAAILKVFKIAELPLDILFEIFKLLLPLDLLQLIRTTKQFRRFLLNRQNAAVWRAASARSTAEGGPPGCPSYMCEPAWAKLVLDNVCTNCHTKMKHRPDVDTVWWEFSGRYCGRCQSSQVSERIPAKLKRCEAGRDWKSVFPRIIAKENTQRWYYKVADMTEFMDVYLATNDTDSREAAIQERLERTSLIMEHAEQCRAWSKLKIQRHRQAAQDKEVGAQIARLKVIVENLNALGWSDEPWMANRLLSTQVLCCSSDAKVPKVLTLPAWRAMKDDLIKQLLEAKRTHILTARLKALQTAVPLILSDHFVTALVIPPPLGDLAVMPEIRALLEVPGDDIPSSAHLASTLGPKLPALAQAWSDEALQRISARAHRCLNLPAEPAPELPQRSPLALAIAFISCPRGCGATGHLPAFLAHPCLFQGHCTHPMGATSWGSGNDAYVALVVELFHRPLWSPNVVEFVESKRLQSMEGVMRAYGRDPWTTTHAEMRGEMRRVCCGGCLGTRKGEGLDWLAALNHCMWFHRLEREPAIVWEMV